MFEVRECYTAGFVNKNCHVRDVQSRFESTVRPCSRLASKDRRSLERLHPGGRGPVVYNTPSSQLRARKALWAFGGAFTPWPPGCVLPDVFSLTGKTLKKKQLKLVASTWKMSMFTFKRALLATTREELATWVHGATSPARDTQLQPSSRCLAPHPTRPGCVSSWPVFLSPEPAGSRTCHGLHQCSPSKSEFINAIFNDIVAQVIVRCCHGRRTLEGLTTRLLPQRPWPELLTPGVTLWWRCCQPHAIDSRPRDSQAWAASPSLTSVGLFYRRGHRPEESSHSLYHLSIVE